MARCLTCRCRPAPRALGPEPLAAALDGALNATSGPRAEVFVRPEDVAIDPEAGVAFKATSGVYTGERHALKLRGPGDLVLRTYAAAPLATGTRIGCQLLRGWQV